MYLLNNQIHNACCIIVLVGFVLCFTFKFTYCLTKLLALDSKLNQPFCCFSKSYFLTKERKVRLMCWQTKHDLSKIIMKRQPETETCFAGHNLVRLTINLLPLCSVLMMWIFWTTMNKMTTIYDLVYLPVFLAIYEKEEPTWKHLDEQNLLAHILNKTF